MCGAKLSVPGRKRVACNSATDRPGSRRLTGRVDLQKAEMIAQSKAERAAVWPLPTLPPAIVGRRSDDRHARQIVAGVENVEVYDVEVPCIANRGWRRS